MTSQTSQTTEMQAALLERANALLPKEPQLSGGLYGRGRTTPDAVVGRVLFYGGFYGRQEFTVDQVRDGKADEVIVAMYHERAITEHWYAFEKDYD